MTKIILLSRAGFKPEKQSHHCVFKSYRCVVWTQQRAVLLYTSERPSFMKVLQSVQDAHNTLENGQTQ